MKGYVGNSVDIDNAIAGRSAQKTKGYVGSVLDSISQYASKLNTRAKTGFAVACLVAAGVVAEYELNREMPASEEGKSQMEKEFPEAGRKERLEAQRNALKLDWMSD